jgi:hypothetical protein
MKHHQVCAMNTLRPRALILIATIATTLTGCAVFPAGDVGRLKPWSVPLSLPTQTVSYTLSTELVEEGIARQVPVDEAGFTANKGLLDAAFSETSRFRSVTWNAAAADLMVTVKTSESVHESAEDFELFHPLFTYLSAGWIPSYFKSHFTVSMTFSDASGRQLGTVQKTEGGVMVFQLLMLPLSFWAVPMVNDLDSHEDVFRAALQEAHRRGYF